MNIFGILFKKFRNQKKIATFVPPQCSGFVYPNIRSRFMISTKIQIKPHLAEYVVGKYGDCDSRLVRFPDTLDVYHTIWDLLQKRPVNCRVDCGNVEIYLPDRREGKKPQTYNFIGHRAERIIERKIETMLHAELHDELDEQRHRYGLEYLNIIFIFMQRYSIDSISEDALLKNYYRWRKALRRKKQRREYKKK